MSYYHQNVTWQSQDGAWNQGFYTRISSMYYDEDYDSEWDDAYDDSFQFVSSGHTTAEDAWRSWGGPNPGSGDEVQYNADTAEEVEHYEDLASRLYEQQGVSRISPIMGKGTAGYYGPHRARTLKAIKAERDKLVESWTHYQIGGYANQIDQQRLDMLDRQIQDCLPQATTQQRQDFETQDAQHLQRIQDQMEKQQRRISDHVRYGVRPPAHSVTAVDELDQYLRQARKAAKKRQKTNQQPKFPVRSPKRHNVTAQRATCGKPTRSGRPCRQPANCPVHR